MTTFVAASGLLSLAATVRADDEAATGVEQREDLARIERFFDEALHASNLRLRVIAGRIPDQTDTAPDGKTMTPIDDLADLARGSTDPVVLALLVEPCRNDRLVPKPRCDGAELAKRLTVADTQNQLAWLTLASTLRFDGDLPAAREAFERGSRAPTWHEYADDAARVITAALPPDLRPRRRYLALQMAMSTPYAQLGPFSALSALSFHCKDPGARNACVRIIDAIDRGSESMFGRQAAIMIGRQMGLDPSTMEARSHKLDALRGAALQSATREPLEMSDRDLAAENARVERRIRLGELEWLRASLAESGVGEDASADAFRKFMAASRARLATRTAADSDQRGSSRREVSAGSAHSTAASQ